MRSDNYVNFREVRDNGQVINATVLFLKREIKPLLHSVVIIAGPVYLVASVLFGSGYANMISSMLGFSQINTIDGSGLSSFGDIYSGAFLAGWLLFIVAWSLLNAVVYGYVKLYINGEGDRGARAVWNVARKNVFSILLITLLYVIIVVVGWFLILIPGIYLSIACSLAYAANCFSGENAFKSIGTSIRLTLGNWWRTFALFFVSYFIITAIINIIYVPAGVGQWLYDNFGDREYQSVAEYYAQDNGTGAIMGVVMALALAFSMVSSAFVLVMQAFYFHSLNEKASGKGMLAKIESIEKEEVDPEPEGDDSAAYAY